MLTTTTQNSQLWSFDALGSFHLHIHGTWWTRAGPKIQENVQWNFKRPPPENWKQTTHQRRNLHQGRKDNAAHDADDAEPTSNGIWIFARSLLRYHPWHLAQISLMETGLNPSRMEFFVWLRATLMVSLLFPSTTLRQMSSSTG
jgi:hypothetical protein